MIEVQNWKAFRSNKRINYEFKREPWKLDNQQIKLHTTLTYLISLKQISSIHWQLSNLVPIFWEMEILTLKNSLSGAFAYKNVALSPWSNYTMVLKWSLMKLDGSNRVFPENGGSKQDYQHQHTWAKVKYPFLSYAKTALASLETMYWISQQQMILHHKYNVYWYILVFRWT